ncbi:unnamed protein product (macronuclear) [Paramecium tetraurelia]|uniref:Uncharacterized protein n=1 Tax=Paramecium tetraurelia TaxID=5888 RepID=A0BBR2_PARTE|nr:uncharacterized protein GSPATT00000414001 [Paramecium tetraurelia]CAK55979.1 unnamed protein product [Paramecium tetraurelia]|eukprot:XP_001423377.1 hypothetical protein (macronuclear) [Paramecium tetraurelia strain d4-2]
MKSYLSVSLQIIISIISSQTLIKLQNNHQAKQSIDDFLLDLVGDKYKQILQAEADMIQNNDLQNKIKLVFDFIESKLSNRNEDDPFMTTFAQVLFRNEYNCETENDLIKIGCDETICLFIKELSYTLNLRFLQEIAYFLLSYRNYIFNNHNINSNSSPLQFGDLMNHFMQEKITYFNDNILEQFYQELQDQDKTFLKLDKSEKLQIKIGLHFCTWLFHSRYNRQNVQFNELRNQILVSLF